MCLIILLYLRFYPEMHDCNNNNNNNNTGVLYIFDRCVPYFFTFKTSENRSSNSIIRPLINTCFSLTYFIYVL